MYLHGRLERLTIQTRMTDKQINQNQKKSKD